MVETLHQKNRETKKSNQRKSLQSFFFSRKTVLFRNESLNRKTADTAIALEKILFPPFYSERFNEISFWFRNNEKRVRARTVEREQGDWLLEWQVI